MTVNVAGNITFFRGNKVIPSAKIERRLKTPYNKTGGVQIEGVIPWEYFKLNGMPVKGSSWKFNLGREFRALNQTTSFGRVINLFNELEHWGELFFSGATPFDNFVTVAPTVLYQGNSNAITGSVKSISNRNFTVEILNSRDIRVGKTTVKSNKRFWIPINVEKQDEGKNFTVNLLDNGKFMEKAVIPVGSLHPSVLIRRFEKLYSGDKEIIFACDVKLPAGTRNGRMRCLFDNGKQKFESLVNIPREGTIELKFPANTLPPGRYRLFCWVDKLDYRDANPSVEFEILPSRRAAL